MRQPCYLPGYVDMEYVQGKFSLFDSLSNFLEKSKSSVLFCSFGVDAVVWLQR